MTRAAVLEGARELFVERGFDATSVDEIARASEVSKGAVYHHFSDKKQLFAELFSEVQGSVMRTVTEVAAAADTDWQQAVEAARTFLRSYAADESARVILRQAPAVLGQERIREIDEKVALPFVRGLLEHLRDTGQLQPVPVVTTARMIFGLLCEATTLVTEGADPSSASEEAETVMLFMLGGLLRTPQTSGPPAQA
ncbi:AcrR family transcriptional regulator [Saccharopolyspora lacisalsi]|uniref:AcrR family transcriptional regulator n=1 Tax=Halosaccharopolyspora lacisalsi TaxID=1000566 RepID=A0A839E124_9PSEU|nr:TetR/AcrR family transcriptional regulator [Halosaccharopolyspora lacisalsi]MBA8826609.1 AcrR family transcriptional regulator [Halosaccharopolyspora lacisalsi]